MTTTRHKKATTIGLTLKHTLSTAGLMLGLAMASPAAAVQCGDTIGPNVTVALSGTLICDDTTTAALTIVGPADVDLSDLDIVCNDTNHNGYVSLGLVIGGQKAKVRNGVVNGCYDGVLVWGQGQHTIERMSTIFSHSVGFYVASPRNILTQNRAADSGFLIETDNNKLSENVAEYCHWGAGFQIEGNKNQLDRNVARYGGWFGFALYGGESNRLTANMVTDNEWGGFEIKTNKTTLRQNQALRNDDGFILYGTGLTVTKNQAHDNRETGIRVSSGAGNVVLTNNVALDNNTGNNVNDFDLGDGALNCSTHTWQSNTFGTANQPCIQ